MQVEMVGCGPKLFWVVIAVLIFVVVMQFVWIFYYRSKNIKLNSELNAMNKLCEEELKTIKDLQSRNEYLSGRVQALDDTLRRYRSPRDNIGTKVPPATTGDPGDENKIIEDSIGQYGPGGRGFGF